MIYVYFGNPRDYEADNDYDALHGYTILGAYSGMYDVEKLDKGDKIYVFISEKNFDEKNILKSLNLGIMMTKDEFLFSS